jgi:hypothetical protein
MRRSRSSRSKEGGGIGKEGKGVGSKFSTEESLEVALIEKSPGILSEGLPHSPGSTKPRVSRRQEQQDERSALVASARAKKFEQKLRQEQQQQQQPVESIEVDVNSTGGNVTEPKCGDEIRIPVRVIVWRTG